MKKSELKKIIQECIIEEGLGGPRIVAFFERNGKRYQLWQDDHYSYFLAMMLRAGTKKVERYNGVNFEKVVADLKKKGYQAVT